MSASRLARASSVPPGNSVGIISRTDVHDLESLAEVDSRTHPIEYAMTPEPYAVAPEEPLANVVRAMVERRLGSAVVVQDARVVGIFTARDAVQALAILIGKRRGVRPTRAT